MNLIPYFSVVIICGAILTGIYYKNYHNLQITKWLPGAAWLRALIYFAFCNVISIITGTFEAIISQPIVTSQQLQDPNWFIFCIGCFLYIFIAYWILWGKMTLPFDRKFYLGSEIIFGILWGGSMGQLLLSFYHLWNMTGWAPWIVYFSSYACMGVWQYFIQDYFWDVYVSPEHDTPRTIILKTLVSHIPNVALCLLFLLTYGNYFLYICTQMFGLIAASIFQRFPAPWAKASFHAPMTKPGLFGLPHGAGYTGDFYLKGDKK